MTPTSLPSTTTNYSLYTIPFYFALALFPHAYSVYVISTESGHQYDNANPRSNKHAASIQKAVPPACFAKYERCRAAHSNMMENMAFMIGAVLAGNMMKLDAGFLNWVLWGGVIGSRVAYLFSYILTEKVTLSRVRTGFYVLATSCSWIVYLKAAAVLARDGMP